MPIFGTSRNGQRQLLICDLDNTLYDWVAYFVPSFYAMVSVASQIMNCDQETLLDELRGVHKKHHNTEQPFALLETATYLNWATRKGENAKIEIDDAFHAFNKSRKSNLKLYPDVEHTLAELKQRNVVIVGYSDSEYFGVVDRVKRLGLERYLSQVFCTPRSKQRKKPFGANTQFTSSVVVEHEFRNKKPNPNALHSICRRFSIGPDKAVYVGDSVSKDIVMASQAGVYSSWAKYGANVNPKLYEQLVRVSHWTKADVERERKLSLDSKEIVPDHICKHSFSELLSIKRLGGQRNFIGRIFDESRIALGLN